MIRLSLFILVSLLSERIYADTTTIPEKCGRWLASVVKDMESVPLAQRYRRGLSRLQTGCDNVLSPVLMNAAKMTLKTKHRDKRFVILMDSAKSYHNESCSYQIPPGKSAEYLNHLCWGDDYPDGPFSGVLSEIDAATYLYGKAIQTELRKNLIMKDSMTKDFYVKKFMLNFFLGAQLEFEKMQSKGEL